MLPGINTDIEFEGKIYHIQTEDSGRANPIVVTLLFQSGRILGSRKTSYQDIINAGNLAMLVREIMNDQHKAMVDDLRKGTYRTTVDKPAAAPAPPAAAASKPGLSEGRGSPAAPAASEPPAPATEGGGAAKRRPAGPKKSLDEMIVDYLADKEQRDKR
jgi:hypothetical protein